MKFEVGNEYESECGTTWFCGEIEEYIFLYAGNRTARIEKEQTDNIAKVFTNNSGGGYTLTKINKLTKHRTLVNDNSRFRKYTSPWVAEALCKTMLIGESYVFRSGRLGTIKKIILLPCENERHTSTYLVVHFPYENKSELIKSQSILNEINLPLQKYNGIIEEKKECDMKICPTIFEEVKRQLELEYDLVKKKNPPILVAVDTMFTVEGIDSTFAVIYAKSIEHRIIEISNNKITETKTPFNQSVSVQVVPLGYMLTSSRKITIL